MAEVNLQLDAGVWGDMAEKFIFLERELTYIDQPLDGLVQSKISTQIYRFECRVLIPDKLWHWKLWPQFSGASRLFLSVIEDRRVQSLSVCSGTWINNNGSETEA